MSRAREPRVEFYRAPDGWRWRFIRNGRIRGDGGQGYSRRIDCEKGAKDVLGVVSAAADGGLWYRNTATGHEGDRGPCPRRAPNPYATCGCGANVYSEKAAQRHAANCEQSGWPRGCPITISLPSTRQGDYHREAPCGQPVVGDFCAKHEAARERLT